MKRMTLVWLSIILACAANLWAAEEPARAGGGGAAGAPGAVTNPWGAGKSAATWYIESIDKTVTLTEDQKKRITEIIEARDKAMKDFQTANAEKLKAASSVMLEAYKRQDKDAVAKAQREYQELYAPMHEIMKKSQADLDAVLTAEQRAKLDESRLAAVIKAQTDPVQLSEEQGKQIRAAYSELTKQGNREAAERNLYETIQKALTPEQKATIFKHRANRYVQSMFKPAELTDQQQKQVDAAIGEMAKQQSDKMDWQAYQKLSEKINGLLNERQKEALKKGRSGMPGASMPGAPAGGGFGVAGQGVHVTQLPGGGVQIILSEGAEGRDREAGRARLGERIKRQRELVEQAWQVWQKLEALGPDKKGEAHELWERLERLESQLRETFEPAGRLALPGQPLNPAIRPEPAIQELRAQVQELRRQMEEVRATLQKLNEREKK